MADRGASMPEPVRVWAPKARRVELVCGELRIEAQPEPGGWWRGPVLSAGDDYAISLDGGQPRPDPRSRWQPHGVHGPSRWQGEAPQGTPGSGARAATPLTDAIL